jgi:NuA3 HAT complex component NTO1
LFQEGLEAIRAKLYQRHYIFVHPFATDLAQVFKEKIGFRHDGNGPVKLTQEQKDIKLRANRIIGRIKPTLMAAARKEAELGHKEDVEEEARQIAIIFDNCVAHSIRGQEDHEDDLDASKLTNGHGGVNSDQDAEGDVEMTDDASPVAPLNGESTATNASEARLDVTDTAVIRLEIGPGQTIPISNINGSVPALSNSGSTNPSTTHPDPLTPPRNEALLDPLAKGGIAWYLERFEPHGTTVYEETWSGRDVLRGMSEELSELDDEAMNGLVEEEMQEAENAAAADAQTLKVIPAAKKRAPPRRKRW